MAGVSPGRPEAPAPASLSGGMLAFCEGTLSLRCEGGRREVVWKRRALMHVKLLSPGKNYFYPQTHLGTGGSCMTNLDFGLAHEHSTQGSGAACPDLFTEKEADRNSNYL